MGILGNVTLTSLCDKFLSDEREKLHRNLEGGLEFRRTSYFWRSLTDSKFRDRVKKEYNLLQEFLDDSMPKYILSYRKTFTCSEIALMNYVASEVEMHNWHSKIKAALVGIGWFALNRYGVRAPASRLFAGQSPWKKSLFDTLKEHRTDKRYWLSLFSSVIDFVGGGYLAYRYFLNTNTPVDMSVVSKTPLLPGRSEFCHGLCPDVIARAKRISNDKAKSELWAEPQYAELDELKKNGHELPASHYV